MHIQLKSAKLIRVVCILIASFISSIVLFWCVLGTVWTQWDFQILDICYKFAVRYGYGPPSSSQVAYVTITDASYDFFGKNILDRTDMAKVNDALAHYSPEAVAYDIIFARPSTPHADQRFAASLTNLGMVYLPIGVDLTQRAHPFTWAEGVAYERLRTDYRKKPREKGTPQPLYATRAIVQMDDFAEVALSTGHIGISSDSDGVYRHIAMLAKLDALYVPTLALSMLLDYVQVPFEDIVINWGHEIVIPATPDGWLEQAVRIPIDIHGQTFIPYVQEWEHDFEKMAAHTLLRYREDEGLQGNLTEFFEGKFVFIGEIATGIADVGPTPLEGHVPLIASHAALLNGLLTNTFYRPWSFWPVLGLIGTLSLLLGLAALPRTPWILYLTGGFLLIGIVGLTWLQFIHFTLVPIVTVSGSFFGLFVGLTIGLQVALTKDQTFIREAFAKYVPEKVVDELLLHPELLQLGGEERILSVLFTDVENFTTMAEQMTPTELVSLLNEYLSEMTAIVLAHGGIVDKYEGDAIMAEFGAPLPMPNHAEMAVRAGLAMQQRLCELRPLWAERGLPALRCRVGINTGPMVIGNMGSHQVFDYTVMGDAVNLAARLESANKLYQTYLMISEFTYAELAPEMFRTRLLDVIKVKGKAQAVKVFEVCSDHDAIEDANTVLYYQTYHAAFEAYMCRDFAMAHEQFAVALSLRPDDPAARTMLARLEDLNAHNLPDDWDGSIALTSK